MKNRVKVGKIYMYTNGIMQCKNRKVGGTMKNIGDQKNKQITVY